MGLLDMLKGLVKPSAEDSPAVKEKLQQFMKQSMKVNDLNGYTIAYGKRIEKNDGLVTKKTTYYNYAIAFNSSNGALVILPIDPKLASCGWPVFITNETLKKAKKVLMGTMYQFDLNDGDYIMFEVPGINGSIGKMLGAMELAITQEEEAKAFKAFFEQYYK